MLRCSDGSYYVGSTQNLEIRLAQHQTGDGAAYTRRRRPVELVWLEEFTRVEQLLRGRNRSKDGAVPSGKPSSRDVIASCRGSLPPAALERRSRVPTGSTTEAGTHRPGLDRLDHGSRVQRSRWGSPATVLAASTSSMSLPSSSTRRGWYTWALRL
nr:GIY-YIG nuclease family protein [Arthrobacter sp. S39]